MHITDWDFRWQHVYREVTPIRLPKGTRLAMEYTYDNSAENVRNPQLPPAKVYWGQRSRDEMGDLWFQLLATNERDRELMREEINTKMAVEDIAGYETMLRVDPGDGELHDDVALLYMGVGQMPQAIRHFEASVALKPDSASAHFNLGTALAQGGRLDEATTAFRAALARRSDYALAHNNLGQVMLAQGKTGDALKHLQQAVRLDANNPQALFGLAETYAAVGSLDLAIETIDRAIKLPMPQALATRVVARRDEYLKRRPE
jgi:tetratricopeptide (TPR) repeat protein